MNQRKTIEVVAAVICDGDRRVCHAERLWRMEGLVGVSWWKNGAWRDARGGADERNQGGTGSGDCSRTAAHNGGARLFEVPPHHALLPLSGGQRKTHAVGT